MTSSIGADCTVASETDSSVVPPFTPERALRVYDLMLRARLLEERLIAMYRQGDGYFWIGGPGEEALNVPLGLLVDKGQGLDHDYLHLHYRSSATLLALGADPVDALRQMKSTATDPYSGGRNFVGHYSLRKWNVVPVTSPIEVQFAIAPGTAMAQRAARARGITIVQGGDAGTAEGDFATCLVWSSRKGHELPLLLVVANNHYGISTPYEGQHGEARISDRGTAFGLRTATIDGNDPEVAWHALALALAYVRSERRPYLLEANVSRLYGHSSASGAHFVEGEVDCLARFEQKLVERGWLSSERAAALRERYARELLEASHRVRAEPQPDPATLGDHVFADVSRETGES